METQTTILNLVSSAKNQEKTQKKLQKINVSQQQQQNQQNQHTCTTFFTQTQHLSKSITVCV